MIYCFKGCGSACSSCGKACDELGKCCKEVCGPCCKVLERPLGGYVLLTAIVNCFVVLCAGIGTVNKDVSDCDQPVMALCAGNVVLGIAHAAFAFYLQYRLVSGMASDRAADLQSHDLMKRAGEIVLYDVGFCLYIFVFIGSFGFNCVGIAWVSDCALEATQPFPLLSCVFLILYAIGVCCFMVLWYCALACDACLGGQKAKSGGQKQKGLLGFLLGSLFNSPQSRSQSSQPQPSSMGAPVVQGYAVTDPPGQAKMSPSHPAPAPVPQQQPGVQAQATQFAAGGLQMAGQGLQAAAGWLGGKKDGKTVGRK